MEVGSMEALKKKLQDEITALEYEFRNELPREILRARELGDLSENAEYHAAKERQGMVNARLGQLQQRLAELSMIDLTKVPRDRIGFGSTVLVYDIVKSVEIEYKLVTSEESDAKKGMVSTSSPIGRGLLNRRVGDELKITVPGGALEYEVVRIVTLHGDKLEA
jgi:transcription elongation factor GreA